MLLEVLYPLLLRKLFATACNPSNLEVKEEINAELAKSFGKDKVSSNKINFHSPRLALV